MVDASKPRLMPREDGEMGASGDALVDRCVLASPSLEPFVPSSLSTCSCFTVTAASFMAAHCEAVSDAALLLRDAKMG